MQVLRNLTLMFPYSFVVSSINLKLNEYFQKYVSGNFTKLAKNSVVFRFFFLNLGTKQQLGTVKQ